MMRTLAGVIQAPFPSFIEPMHPTQYAKLPTGVRWRYELKLDGWRGQLHVRNGRATMYSRNGNDLTAKCEAIMGAARDLHASSAVIDGEIAVPGENGIPNFLALKPAMTRAPESVFFLPSTCCISTAMTFATRRSRTDGVYWRTCSRHRRAGGSC
jgi:ATP-dependent DNA ligase